MNLILMALTAVLPAGMLLAMAMRRPQAQKVVVRARR